jgi:hypothetical protein
MEEDDENFLQPNYYLLELEIQRRLVEKVLDLALTQTLKQPKRGLCDTAASFIVMGAG